MLGRFMQGHRKRRDVSVKDLADVVGISRQALYAWERGQKLPTLANLTSWSDALRLSDMDRYTATQILALSEPSQAAT